MSAAETALVLNTLAKSRAPEDRERLLLAIVDLCGKADSAVRAPAVQDLLGSIFMNLVSTAEQDIRRLLAEKLSTADWPPTALVNVLAFDDIEIARPMIAASPVLKDVDLVRLLVESTIEHQIEVARRPSIGPPVVETILNQAETPVLTALAGNETADISPPAMARLVEASRQIAGMRSPLARHPRLTSDMAKRLYMWVGDSLRSAIVSRFKVDASALDRAIVDAVAEAHAQAPTRTAAESPAWRPVSLNDEAEMERRLIAKLNAAGQLRPGYLLRALRERKLSLFTLALATLGDFTPQEVQKALNTDRPELLALACCAVGVDKSVFGLILTLVRDLNMSHPNGDLVRAGKAFEMFGPARMMEAAAAFRKAVAAV